MKDNKRNTKPLSARAIDAMRPSDPDKSDAGEYIGLRVSCGASGAKTFIYRFNSPETGKLTQLKIGSYPKVSLAEARVRLMELKDLRNSGVCPKAEHDRQLQKVQAEKAILRQEEELARFTVQDLVEMYLTQVIEDRMVPDRRTKALKRVAGARKPKGQAETRRTLYNDPVRVLGDKGASEVTRKDVVAMVKEILDRGANVQAGNVLREFTAAYEYAIGLEKFPDNFANPALLAKSSLKMAKVKMTPNKGRRVLSDNELRELMAWLPGSGFSTTQKNVIRLTLWTGCRTGEVCQAAWKDVDLEKGVWHMRDSKNGAERFVQLPRQAVEFLRQLSLNGVEYVFMSTRSGLPIQQKSLSEMKWHMKNPDLLKGRRTFRPEQLWLNTIDDWSPHDLRRTVRTGLARLGCPSEVAEAVLGHSRKGIEGTYDLHGYEKECREWLQRWADHLDGLM